MIGLIIALSITIGLLSLTILTYLVIHSLIPFLKNLNWQLVFSNFDITRLLGRSYYLINFITIILIDLIFLLIYNFQFILTFFSIILVLITISNTINFSLSLILKAVSDSYTLNIADKTERSSVSSGVPRCGKTSSKNFTAVSLAKKQWKSLQRDYWFCVNYPLERLPNKLRAHKNEIMKAYEHAIKNVEKFVPCLYSFQTIFVGTRQSYPLTKRMLLQREALPYRVVAMADEIGYIFPNKKRKSEEDSVVDLDKLSDLCRFIGHYLDGYLLLTEQEFSKAFIDIRRVTGENIYFTQKQQWVMPPKFLSFIYEFIFTIYDWYLWKITTLKKESPNHYIALQQLYNSSLRNFKFMKWLKKLISCVGYRKYKYRSLSNTEVEGKTTENKKGTFYLPAPLNCTYNERVYRNMYECKDQPLTQPKYQNFFPTLQELKDRFSD